MNIRKYPDGVIYEFDSLDELRQFDPAFIENIDSEIFDNIVSVLPCLACIPPELWTLLLAENIPLCAILETHTDKGGIMLLAEALAERAQAQERLNSLHERLLAVVRVQEGDTPEEDPQELV